MALIINMQLGIGSYAYAWAVGVRGHPPAQPMTAFELLDEAVRLGVRLVQICDNLPLTRLTPAELDRFQALAAGRKIQVEVGTMGLNPENLRAYLQLARRFGSLFVRLVVDSPGDEPTPEAIVSRLRPIVDEYAAARVRLAIENHDRLRSETLAWIVEQLGVQHVGICLDTVNSFGSLEGPAVVVKNLGRYTLCLHAKDFTIRRVNHQMGFVREGCRREQDNWMCRGCSVNSPAARIRLMSCSKHGLRRVARSPTRLRGNGHGPNKPSSICAD